ncbi:Uncharacterized [Syntrophomonas zehnderi OL-4]|uniref:Uncharacterized n=1 Tax=Syntrophomonas zehnderi OL-4 TaxID=690567 RepID=A0A0E4GCF1_9FIRM|nr:hypothetical protein [Syntrophomonas zehnderi]CFX13331.1 Uncharacterized [Syntrophomonas zehnderi OL-4]
MILSMFPLAASANTNQAPITETIPTITKDNVQTIIESAKQGDENAIQAISNLECFNPDKIRQKGTLRVSSKEGSKEYFFDDGSSITMSVGREICPEISTKSDFYYEDYGMHQWKVAGVEVARYYIRHLIRVAGDRRSGRSDSHWDDSDAIPGVYTVTEYGTTLHSGNTYDVCWVLRGAGKFKNVQTSVSSPKYIFEFVDDIAGNSNTLEVISP